MTVTVTRSARSLAAEAAFRARRGALALVLDVRRQLPDTGRRVTADLRNHAET